MRAVGDFLRMGHGRSKAETDAEWGREGGDDEADFFGGGGGGIGHTEGASQDVWRSKMGWGPRLPGSEMDAVEYESQLMDLERMQSHASGGGSQSTDSRDNDDDDDDDDPLAVLDESVDRRQRILMGLGHVSVQIAEFVACMLLLWGTGLYLLVGEPGVGGAVYVVVPCRTSP